MNFAKHAAVVAMVAVVSVTFGVTAVPTPAGAADDWRPMSRAKALERTSSSQIELRRQAYARLGEVGTMEDVPLLLSALQDDEDLIRGVAELSVWGIWMRANDSTVDPMFQVAMDLTQQMKLAEAEAGFDAVIELRPDFAEAWHRRGEVKVIGDRWNAAAADFARALELNPYHFGALEGLGHCSMRLGRATEAVKLFQQALDINPYLEGVYEALKRARDMAERERT
jgi:tetratricopeptide (TPR) repeat protein